MRVTAEEGYLNKLKDDGSIFVGGYCDHVQAYLFSRNKSHRKKETYYPSSKMNRRDEMSRYLSQSSSVFPTHEGEVLSRYKCREAVVSDE